MAGARGSTRWSRAARSRARARRHVAAAGRFAGEVGGLDREVKAFLLGLPAEQVEPILDIYQRQYGPAARRYAAAAIPRWRSGVTTVSGQTAARLFALVPPFMPAALRHRLVEALWVQYLPATSARIEVGEDGPGEACERIRALVRDGVAAYKLPAQLRARFEWLSAGDATCVQALLARLLEREADQAAVAAAAEIERIRAQVVDGRVDVHYERAIVAGRHTIRLCWAHRNPILPKVTLPAFPRPSRGQLAEVGWCLAAALFIAAVGSAWWLALTTLSASGASP